MSDEMWKSRRGQTYVQDLLKGKTPELDPQLSRLGLLWCALESVAASVDTLLCCLEEEDFGREFFLQVTDAGTEVFRRAKEVEEQLDAAHDRYQQSLDERAGSTPDDSVEHLR